ncbi:MAG: hypothetical protein JWM11_837 [Planctomycetaceae bacterium]|nr:hypothetical protein [Planctomycetaceae bacterium]
MRLIVITCLAALFGVFGCVSHPSKVASVPKVLVGNDVTVRQQLLSLIPIGTTQTEAEEIAESIGLTCSQEVDWKTKVPYLSCSYSSQEGVWVTWTWKIRIDCPSGKVADISCKHAGIGP